MTIDIFVGLKTSLVGATHGQIEFDAREYGCNPRERLPAFIAETAVTMKERTRGPNPDVQPRGDYSDSSLGESNSETVHSPCTLDTTVWDADSLEPEELVARLCEDQVRRWNLGQRVPAEAYLARCPGLELESEAAFELIYSEFLLREQIGDSPTTEEFSWRFPQFADRFARQLELHGILNSDFAGTQTIVRSGSSAGVSDEKKTGGANRSAPPGYEILGELGRGGMGIVYKAWQVSLKRVVALKVIRAGVHTDTDGSARFHAEAEASARFQHPNIVQVFEVGENDDLDYLVLEYVSGGGLDRKLSGSLQNPGESAQLLESLARAIHYAHQRGIVHRDLKPANVLLTEDGIPKITDFGLAKLLERDDGLTNVGELMGTPSYMAPEQVKGTSRQITPATDVYASRSDPLRNADGPAAVQGNDAFVDSGAGREPRATDAQQDSAAYAPRLGNNLSKVPAKRSATAVRQCGATGR